MIRSRIGQLALAVLLVAGWPTDGPCGTTGKISGQVTDAYGAPLPGAAVWIEHSQGLLTDEEGLYFILSVEPGMHTLIASMIGYDSLHVEGVRVTSDMTTNVSFALKEAPIALGEIVVEEQRGNTNPGLFSTWKAPPVDPDQTATTQVVRRGDFEALPLVRSTLAFIELLAGVAVDEDEEELTIRAGDPEDVAYYLDGVLIPSTDHVSTRVYRDFNRLAIQEMTVVTGGMNAEYGNAQGGIVSVVMREGGERFGGLMDYQYTPPGKKHWGANVYESSIHRGNVHWDDPTWASERVKLQDGREVLAHPRQDYTGVAGHFLEGNLSGPVARDLSFFLSSRWKRQASVFPGPYPTTPRNLNTSLKLTHRTTQNFKLNVGALYDRRREAFQGSIYPYQETLMDIRYGGRNLFLADSNPLGDVADTDALAYAGITHILSTNTFYEVRISQSVSTRDTTDVWLPEGTIHISEALSGQAVKDRSGIFTVSRPLIGWERFRRSRLSFKADLSSQVNRRHFVKVGLEAIRFDNWYQSYKAKDLELTVNTGGGDGLRYAQWYGKTYEDTDFFPGRENRGLNPVQLGLYVQDKIELNGMIVNAGLRYDVLFQNTRVTDVDGFLGAPKMWDMMTRARNAPTVRGAAITSLSHRLGVSHPMGERSVIRFFYGRFTQFPSFEHLFINSSISTVATDQDLNGNGTLDSAERWNTFGSGGAADQHNPHLPPEETTSFEVGMDWNFVSDYVVNLTTYYKGANNNIMGGSQSWWNPAPRFARGAFLTFAPGAYRDIRGVELGLKKRFSNLFAFNFALNLQWADQGHTAAHRRDTYPDSLFVANGHLWTAWDVDPLTGAETPVSLREMAIREGKDPDFYIWKYGHTANEEIRKMQLKVEATERDWSWIPWLSHYAAEGVAFYPGQIDRSFYSDEDRKFWERITSDPDYPGVGEGNLLVVHRQEPRARTAQDRDRRSFGSLAVLFATPERFGPLSGKPLSRIRANLIYRLYTGTPITYTPLVTDPVTGLLKGGAPVVRYGPMHTRIDMNLEKQFGHSEGANLTLAVEIYNLFNQKDVRSTPPEGGIRIDFDADIWQQWGIEGLTPDNPDAAIYGEINDVTNYWDQPREMTLSLRLRW